MEADRAHGTPPARHRHSTQRVEYARRRPETTVLHRIVAEHLETFLAEAARTDEHGRGVPAYLERAFRKYLECGVLAHGFVRVHCDVCRTDRLVAFSCKGRGICPSCQGRRMADAAAHLVNECLPVAPYRQWTLSVPRPVRARMLCEPAFLSRVLRIFLGTVFAYQRRRARAAGIATPKVAAVTSLQRFGSALNLHPHFHSVIPDGVFAKGQDGALAFHALPPPTDDDVFALTVRIARRLLRHLADYDDESDLEPWTAGIGDALVPLLPAAGSNPSPAARRRTAAIEGFSLHADTAVTENDRAGLERLLRYGLRPAFAQGRLELTPAGNVSYRLRRPWSSGQTHVTLPPTAFLRRLAWLVPPPRQNLLRFHGLLASAASDRDAFIAMAPASTADTTGAASHPIVERDPIPVGSTLPPSRKRIPWAALLARVFAVDVLECPDCHGRMRVLAMLTHPEPVAATLNHLGLPTRPRAVAPARAPPEPDLWYDHA